MFQPVDIDKVADQISLLEERIGRLEIEIKVLRRKSCSALTSARERVYTRNLITQQSQELLNLQRRVEALRESYIKNDPTLVSAVMLTA
jgi:hypothetical protein